MKFIRTKIMTGQLPYGEATADYVIMRRIFESPRPQVNGESRLSDCLQVWDMMTRCWTVEPEQRPTSAMCKTTIDYLPGLPPGIETADSPTQSAALLEKLGELESWNGNEKEAFAYLEQALQLYEEEGNDKGIALVLRKQTAVAWLSSDHVKTLVYASAALEKCKSLNDEVGIADSLRFIGCSHLSRDQLEAALPLFLESLEMFRAQENSVGISRCLERLGELYRRNDQYTEALLALEEAVDIASVCGWRLGEAQALFVLGETQRQMGDDNQAFRTYQKARDVAPSIGWGSGLSNSLCRLGVMEIRRGNYPEAEELLREAITVARRNDAVYALAQALHKLAVCHAYRGKLPEARLALEESYQIYQDLAELPSRVFAADSASLADTLVVPLGEFDHALTWYDRAIAVYRMRGTLGAISRCLSQKARLLVVMGRYDEGALYFEASMAVDWELGNDSGVKWNQNKLSGIPMTPIKWEVRRQASLALYKIQSPGPTSLLCDVKKLQRRVPQLTTPHLKSAVELVKRSDS